MSIFRAYDIRGIYGKDLTDDIMLKIGNAFRRFVGDSVIVGCDHRLSSPALKDAFIRGATQAGKNVIDISVVPRGASMFWAGKTGLNTCYITASHLPKEWNGLKFVRSDGTSFTGNESMEIKRAVEHGDFYRADKPGSVAKEEIIGQYVNFLVGRIPRPGKPLKVLLDCGNGTAGMAAPELFRKMGYYAEPLFGEPDGSFPNRESEITPEALEKTLPESANYDVTFAYDGDADRLSMVDDKGRIVEPEIVAYIIMKELLKQQQGPIVANVECSKIIDKIAKEFGRDVIRSAVGYSFVIKCLHENKACFGIEKSMHFCIPSIFHFDDGIASSLFAAYAVSRLGEPLSEFVDRMPKFIQETRNFDCGDDVKFDVIKRVSEQSAKEYEKLSNLDGVRVQLDDGWVLVRASNTSPLIRMTVEADTAERFKELSEKFSSMVAQEIKNAEPTVDL